MISPPVDLLDIVYEAAVDETKWPLAIDGVCDEIGADMACLRILDSSTLLCTSAVGRLDPDMISPFMDYYQYINPVNTPAAVARARSRGASTIGLTVDRLSRDEFARSEFYNDFFKVFDVYDDMWVRLGQVDRKAVNINLMRSHRRGDWEMEDVARLKSIQPHLARAVRVGRQVGALRALGKDLAQVLDHSPYGLILLDEEGIVRRTNRAAESMTRANRGLSIRRGKVELVGHEAGRRLAELIHQASLLFREGGAGGSMAVFGEDGEPRFSIIVAPLAAHHAPDLFAGPAVMISITDHAAGMTLPEQRLRDLFSLTTGEARVANALLEGLTPSEAATRLDIGLATVRFHLSHILEKTRCRSQADLCRLLVRTIGMGVA